MKLILQVNTQRNSTNLITLMNLKNLINLKNSINLNNSKNLTNLTNLINLKNLTNLRNSTNSHIFFFPDLYRSYNSFYLILILFKELFPYRSPE